MSIPVEAGAYAEGFEAGKAAVAEELALLQRAHGLLRIAVTNIAGESGAWRPGLIIGGTWPVRR